MWLNWHTLYEVLEGEKSHIKHLRVFGCGAYVHIPQAVWKDRLCLKSELMTYTSIAPRDHGNIFMCSPENVVFTSAHADFNENLFPWYLANKKQDQIPSRSAKTSLLNSDGPSDDNKDIYHYTPYPSPIGNMKMIKADLMTISVCIQLRKCQICCSQFNEKEHYQIGENTLLPRCNPLQVQTVPCQPGNIYGEQRHPIDQLNMER